MQNVPPSPIVLFFITHADGSCRGMVFTPVCLSVYPHDISKTDVARITKLDTQMFHFGVKVSKSQHKNCAGVGLCTLVRACFLFNEPVFYGCLSVGKPLRVMSEILY